MKGNTRERTGNDVVVYCFEEGKRVRRYVLLRFWPRGGCCCSLFRGEARKGWTPSFALRRLGKYVLTYCFEDESKWGVNFALLRG